jgi:hypothetical protein
MRPDLPSKEDRLKRSQSGSSSGAAVEPGGGGLEGEKGVAKGFNLEGSPAVVAASPGFREGGDGGALGLMFIW